METTLSESPLSHNSIFTISASVVASELDGEVILLDVQSGNYYGLKNVGVFVWQMLKNDASFDEMSDAIVAEYMVSQERCRADLTELLEDMLQRGIIAQSHDLAPA
ncbi:PqqD family protein [Chloroflexi bacterium TSY]|nr:PqqD family protein [Chloroflexi bacterium TSY]